MRTLFVLILLGLACPGRSDEIPPHILNLARIEHLMTAELKRQFNYTCLETIDRYRALPGGLSIPLRLDLPIDSQHAAVGDEIRAVVSKAVRFGDQVLLPRGALVKGVIRRLDRHSGNLPYFEVGLEFNEAEYGTHHAALFGKPDEMTPFSGYHRTAIGYATGPPDKLSPGVGYFYVEGESIRIPKGLGFSLQTESARPR